jgi:hypothetical protein
MANESYLLTNGQTIIFGPARVQFTRPGSFGDVIMTLLTVGFAVAAFVTTLASFGSLADGFTFAGALCLLAGLGGLVTSWMMYRRAMGGIAGLPETAVERRGGEVSVFGDAFPVGDVAFFGRWGKLGLRCGEQETLLAGGLIQEEVVTLAERLNEVLFADVVAVESPARMVGELSEA